MITRATFRTLTATRSAATRSICTTPAVWKESGHCKWFDSKKGYGFISPDDGSGDVFVHQTVIHAEGFRSLDEGEAVEYDVVHTDDGVTWVNDSKATNVGAAVSNMIFEVAHKSYGHAVTCDVTDRMYAFVMSGSISTTCV